MMMILQLLLAFLIATSSATQTTRTRKTCRSGKRDAKRAVQRLYRGDCNNALDNAFTEDVNRMRDRTFPRFAKNWRDRAYNECGRDAIRKELDRIGRRCRNSQEAAGDCSELGETAATIIVDNSGVCPRHFRRQRKRNNLKKFREECRSVAYGQCKGYIDDAVHNCGGDGLSLREQSHLQDECEDKVDSLTGHGGDVDFMNDQFLEGYSGDESASSEDWDYETSEEW